MKTKQTPSASNVTSEMNALLGWASTARTDPALALEHKRDGVRVDGVRIDGPCFGSDGWYVKVRVAGQRDRLVAYDVYLREISNGRGEVRPFSERSRERTRGSFKPGNSANPAGRPSGRKKLDQWLKARHAHNAARRFDDADEAEET